MKNQILPLALVIGLGALPGTLSAKSKEQAYLELYRDQTQTPVPVSVVSPVISTDYAGTELDLVFSLDQRGRPQRIYSEPRAPLKLEQTLTEALRRWRFTPRLNENGEPVPVKLRLPILITDPRNG